jgi:hypothetical protein
MTNAIRSPNIELRLDRLVIRSDFGIRHSDYPAVVALHAGRHIARFARCGADEIR